jgi:deoxycytidine triphosphate deaminase
MILSDVDIRRGGFISQEFDESSLRGCTYEFRVSELAYRYDYENRFSRQEKSNNHLINPFETVTVITKERVNMGRSHFLSLYSKGFLFSLGIVPVCTGADPGFEGRLGISLTNMSGRPVVLPVDTKFVKGTFHQMTRPAERPYAGQHGDASVSWPYPAQFHPADFDQKQYLASIDRFLPPSIVRAIRVAESVTQKLHILMGLLITIALLNLSSYGASKLLPATQWPRIIDSLNIAGAIASIISLMIVLLQQARISAFNRDGNEKTKR